MRPERLYNTLGKSGHRSLWHACEYPLSAVKRTWAGALQKNTLVSG
jgi:hypothetical protein